jgi:general secretion pathway protein E
MASIGDMLMDAGLARDRLEECRSLAATSGDSLDQVLLQKDYLDETTLLQIYAKHLGYEFRKSLEGTKVPADFVDGVPVHFARNYNLIALEAGPDGVMKVATCRPLDPHPMDDLSSIVGGEVDAVLAPRLEITSLIARAYRHKADGVDEALDAVADDADIQSMAAEIEEAEDVLDVSNKAPIIKLVNTILFQALKLRASDVHLQCYPDRFASASTASCTTWIPSPERSRTRSSAASRSWARWTSPSGACPKTAARRSRSATARSTSVSARSPPPTVSAS